MNMVNSSSPSGSDCPLRSPTDIVMLESVGVVNSADCHDDWSPCRVVDGILIT